MNNLYTQLKNAVAQCLSDVNVTPEELAGFFKNLVQLEAREKEERKREFLKRIYSDWVTNSDEYSSSELLARYVTWTMAKTHPDWTLQDCEKYLEVMTQTLGPDTDNFAKNSGYVTSY